MLYILGEKKSTKDHLRCVYRRIIKPHTTSTASTIFHRKSRYASNTIRAPSQKAYIDDRSTSHPRDHARSSLLDIRERWQKEKCSIRTATPLKEWSVDLILWPCPRKAFSQHLSAHTLFNLEHFLGIWYSTPSTLIPPTQPEADASDQALTEPKMHPSTAL